MQWTHPSNINFIAFLALILFLYFGVSICILIWKSILFLWLCLFSFISFCFMVFWLPLFSYLYPWSRTRSGTWSLWFVMQLEILHIQCPSQGVPWLRSSLAGCKCSIQLPSDTLLSREQFIDLVFQLPFTTFQLQLSPWFQAQRLAWVQAFDRALLALLSL